MSRTARRIVQQVARVGDRIAAPPDGVVVLAYHQVGAPGTGPVNIAPSVFAEQMAMLAAGAGSGPGTESGRVIDLDQAIDALVTDAAPTSGRVVVTFDDGTADFVDEALPILVDHQIPATLYLATDFVERGRSFWDDDTVLSWAALREALSTGLVTIGSHTHTHVLLDRVDRRTAIDELDRSIGLIGERLGVPADHFAYPKALAPNVVADVAVRERFRSAALAGGRPNRFGRTDVWSLARTPVLAADGVTWFERKARGGLRLEGALRERLDARRHRGATR